MTRLSSLFFWVTWLSSSVNGAKILAIFPVPVRSHFVMTKTILAALAAKGHEVDLFTIFPEHEKIPGIRHYQIPGIKLLDTPLTVADLRAISVVEIIDIMFTEKGNGNNLCEESFKSDVLKELKQSKKQYDLLLLEMFVVDCFFGFSHIFKVPIVAITSSVDLPWGSHRIGNMDNPSYIQTYFGEFDANMSLYQRILNTLTLIYAKYRHKVHLSHQEQLAKEFFGNDMLPLDNIVSNTSLMIVNSHFSLNEPRPTVPNFIEVAGIHIRETKVLPKDILDFIENDKFIYFSFGSIVGSETLPVEKLQCILDILDEHGFKVLWKANRNSLPEKLNVSKSVYMKPWMPQLDILCHPNIHFFISHSGLMGTQEAIYCGVPMLSVPMFADQFLNAKNNAIIGLGLTLNFEIMEEKDIKSTMKELIENPKYKDNAKELSRKFKDRPSKPLDEAVFWIEYVIRYGGAPHLKSRSADLQWYQYYLIDVGFVLGTISICFLYFLFRIILFGFTVMRMNKEKQQ